MNDDTIRREPLKEELGKSTVTITGYGKAVFLDKAYDIIDEAQPVQMWTPCSEKQPKSDGVYYVTVTFNGKSVTRDQVFHEGRWLPLGKLVVNGVSGEPEVIAWMEKPAPYQAPVLDLGRGM